MTARGGHDNRRRRRLIPVTAAAAILLVLLVASALAASTDFVPLAGSPEPARDGPGSVVAADLDGDLDRDLAVANSNEGNVSIFRNPGTGDFVEVPSSPEDAGVDPASLAAADLDGDGDRDLAVANAGTDDVTILRNNGSGNFSEPASSPEPVGDFPFSVVAGDLDGDGDQDLAVPNEFDNNVSILRNNGSGNFSEPGSSPEQVGDGPIAIVAANFDADADTDLAVANAFANSVSFMRNNGSGNFVVPASSPEPTGDFPRAIVAADLDGDSDRDLATANLGTDNVTILRNAGTGNFIQPPTSPETAGTDPGGITAADFDLDGDQDLATANITSADVTVLRNPGSVNLNQVPTSPEDAGTGAGALHAAPLDADPDPDLAVANFGEDTISILGNQ
jgi:hypothetical protein